jgi:hypothetical protein
VTHEEFQREKEEFDRLWEESEQFSPFWIGCVLALVLIVLVVVIAATI